MGRPKKVANTIVLPQELPVVNQEVEVLKMELEQLQRRHANLYAAFKALNKTKNDILDLLMAEAVNTIVENQ